MNREQVGSKLQALLENTVRKDKLIHNAVLGMADDASGFRWSGAAGFADEAGRTPMQAGTPFFLASITKMYTASAILLLQERGRLTLDDRIASHLPGALIDGLHRYKGTDYTSQLTIRHLVSQTSGLADYSLQRPKSGGKSVHEKLFTEGDRAISLDEMARLVREELTPAFPPGTPGKAHYSDTNYQLLGAIIEAVAERPLPEVFAEFFFGPLGLTETYLSGHPRTEAPAEPARIFYKDRALHIPQAMKSIAAQGGMIATVDDCLRFLRALTQGEVFARPETFAAMQQQWNKIFFPLQYGYGLMRFAMPRIMSPFAPAPELIGHSGSTGSFLYYSPERKLYLAGTINQPLRQRGPFALMLQAAEIVRKGLR